MSNNLSQQYQSELLTQARNKFSFSPLSVRVCEAYWNVPRHKFIHHFSIDHQQWMTLSEENLETYLPVIYADSPLLLYEQDEFICTISQPSFVLRMLDLLDLSLGMRAFELGAGSGWNAALMGELVGKKGKVISYEIIPQMAAEAASNVAKMDLPQVEIRQGDAIAALAHESEFDRGIFTAGAWDFPGDFFELIKDQGKLLFVLKTLRGDILLAMKKVQEHFEIFEKIHCSFVPVTGDQDSYGRIDLSEVLLAEGSMQIYPQGTIGLKEKIIAGKDALFVMGI
jgi:protein-L-isoaspartate(D-aspartate) O-methyltransferase